MTISLERYSRLLVSKSRVPVCSHIPIPQLLWIESSLSTCSILGWSVAVIGTNWFLSHQQDYFSYFILTKFACSSRMTPTDTKFTSIFCQLMRHWWFSSVTMKTTHNIFGEYKHYNGPRRKHWIEALISKFIFQSV